jgi:hypothetical protein
MFGVVGLAGPAQAADIDLTASERYYNSSYSRSGNAVCRVNVHPPRNVNSNQDIVVKGTVSCNVKMRRGAMVDLAIEDRYVSAGNSWDSDVATIRRNVGNKSGTFSVRFEVDDSYRWARGTWHVTDPSLDLEFANPFNGSTEWMWNYRSARVESFRVN